MTVHLEIQLAGEEPRRMTLDQFLAENEGAEHACRTVQTLAVGDTYMGAALTVTRIEPPPKGPRVARFKVHFGHRKYKAEGATVTINRDTGIVTVRLFRRRAEHVANLADLAALVYERSIAAERVKKRKEKALRKKVAR